jgi:hypothetical protein
MKNNTNSIAFVCSLIFITAIFRVINAEAHLYNLVPVAAIGLFSGSILQNRKWAYLIPLVAMFLSDLGLELFTKTPGFYGISQFINYGALALVTLLGTQLVNRKPLQIAGFTLTGSLIFFLLSNFGTFLQGYYGFSFSGLITCYTMAIPFYKYEMATTFFVNSFMGDLLFSTIAFGLLSAIKIRENKMQVI